MKPRDQGWRTEYPKDETWYILGKSKHRTLTYGHDKFYWTSYQFIKSYRGTHEYSYIYELVDRHKNLVRLLNVRK